MTDDQERIAALFRDAAGDPPPGFDHDAVVRRSRRVTAQRRNAVFGSAMALLVVVGVGVVVNRPTEEPASSAAAPAAERAEDAAGAADSPFAAAEPAPDLRPGEPLEGRLPLGPGTTPCVQRQDPQLRVLLDDVLPEVANAAEAAVTDECRPGGTREVNLEVTDGAASGRLTVVSYPAGEDYLVAPDGAVATAPTGSNGTVVVRSAGDGPGAAVPFAGRLADIATALAPLL